MTPQIKTVFSAPHKPVKSKIGKAEYNSKESIEANKMMLDSKFIDCVKKAFEEGIKDGKYATMIVRTYYVVSDLEAGFSPFVIESYRWVAVFAFIKTFMSKENCEIKSKEMNLLENFSSMMAKYHFNAL